MPHKPPIPWTIEMSSGSSRYRFRGLMAIRPKQTTDAVAPKIRPAQAGT
jgi:hypothetical protein